MLIRIYSLEVAFWDLVCVEITFNFQKILEIDLFYEQRKMDIGHVYVTLNILITFQICLNMTK